MENEREEEREVIPTGKIRMREDTWRNRGSERGDERENKRERE